MFWTPRVLLFYSSIITQSPDSLTPKKLIICSSFVEKEKDCYINVSLQPQIRVFQKRAQESKIHYKKRNMTIFLS